MTSVKSLSEILKSALEDNKAEDISLIDLKGKADFADFMLIASGRSQRHVSSLADNLIDSVKKSGYSLLSIEGKPQCDWVLVDFGDVVVHLFKPEIRSFYNLEKMWSVPVSSTDSISSSNELAAI